MCCACLHSLSPQLLPVLWKWLHSGVFFPFHLVSYSAAFLVLLFVSLLVSSPLLYLLCLQKSHMLRSVRERHWGWPYLSALASLARSLLLQGNPIGARREEEAKSSTRLKAEELGEEPSRVLFVRNVQTAAADGCGEDCSFCWMMLLFVLHTSWVPLRESCFFDSDTAFLLVTEESLTWKVFRVCRHLCHEPEILLLLSWYGRGAQDGRWRKSLGFLLLRLVLESEQWYRQSWAWTLPAFRPRLLSWQIWLPVHTYSFCIFIFILGEVKENLPAFFFLTFHLRIRIISQKICSSTSFKTLTGPCQQVPHAAAPPAPALCHFPVRPRSPASCPLHIACQLLTGTALSVPSAHVCLRRPLFPRVTLTECSEDGFILDFQVLPLLKSSAQALFLYTQSLF